MDRWLENNLFVRILSVILAVFLWFQVAGGESLETTKRIEGVPLRLVNLGGDFVVLNTPPETVEIAVRGPGQLIGRMDREGFAATVDLRGAQIGTHSYLVSVSVPKGVQLLEVSPGSISLEVDVLMAREIPVRIQLTGSVGRDYRTHPMRVKPEEVWVEGPSSILKLVDTVRGTLDITGTKSDLQTEVAVVPVDRRGSEINGLELSPASVKVIIPVEKLPPAKRVAVVPQITGEPAEGFRFVSDPLVEPAQVTIRGPEEVIKDLEEIKTEPVDISGARGNVSAETKLILPEGVASAEPEDVMVLVEILEDVQEKSWENLPVEIRNLPEGMEAELGVQEIKVSLVGPVDVMGGLTAADLKPYVDASGLAAGEHLVPVELVLPEEIISVVMEPEEVGLKLAPEVEGPPEGQEAPPEGEPSEGGDTAQPEPAPGDDAGDTLGVRGGKGTVE